MISGMKKNDLEVIKEGKTGHGILIENDGYMYVKNPQMIKESLENGEWNVPYPFVVDAVFRIGIGAVAHTHLAGAIGEVSQAELFVEPYIMPPGKAPGARPVVGCFVAVVVEVPIC